MLHQYTTEVYDNNYLNDLVVRIATTENLMHGVSAGYNSKDIPHLDNADYTFHETQNGRDNKSGVWIYKGAGDKSPEDTVGVAYLTYSNDNLSIRVSAITRELAEQIMADHKMACPEIQVVKNVKPIVPVKFWFLSPDGPRQIMRQLPVPEWKDIKNNYSEETRKGLEMMFNPEFRPNFGGQFVLWLGEPGTGKTTALRALAREWQDWCDIQFITDPDAFFGGSVSYMMSFLMQAETTDDNPYFDHADYEELVSSAEELGIELEVEEEGDESESKWKLVVFEDTGELLTTTAKADTGQALSRFLNVVDGMIGQGLKIIVLITTNEDFGQMNKAVTRPGRCRAKIDFKPLTRDESNEWIKQNELDVDFIGSEKTLAQLYELKNEQIKVEESAKVFGFNG